MARGCRKAALMLNEAQRPRLFTTFQKHLGRPAIVEVRDRASVSSRLPAESYRPRRRGSGEPPTPAKGFRPPEVRPLEEGRHLKISSPEPVEVAEARLLQAFERAKYAALLEIDDTYCL